MINSIFSFEDLFPLEPYHKFNPDDWLAKIKESVVYREYPSASIDLYYVDQLGERFDFSVLQQRAEILLREVAAAGYHRGNISEHAIVDVAKARKISYFLKDPRCSKKILAKIKAKL